MSGDGQTMNAGCTRIPPRCEPQVPFRKIPFLVLLTAAGCGAAALFLFNPEQHSFYPFCFFYRTTGLLCPGCGALRALHQILHGNLASALRFNSLLVASLPVVGFFMGRFVVCKMKKQPASHIIPSVWLWWALGVMLAFGVLRNLRFAQSLWLAP